MKTPFAILMSLLLMLSCSEEKKQEEGEVVYTCSMHPQVMETKPGKCPICKMPLTPVKKTEAESHTELILNQRQILLGNIITDSARRRELGEEIRLNARLTADQNANVTVSARVMGRIEKLYVKAEGEYVKKGMPLYLLYSEDLNMVIREMLIAAEKTQGPGDALFEPANILAAAKRKLMLYGLTENQCEELLSARQVPETVEILSPEEGIVNSVQAKEGEYLMEGAEILQLNSLKNLWVEIQLYPGDLGHIRSGAVTRVDIPAAGKSFTSEIRFIQPEFAGGSQLNLAYLSIANEDQALVPGLLATVSFQYNRRSAFSIPSNAVLEDSRGSTVWIKNSNRFKSFMIEKGLEAGGYTEVLKGLSPKDTVVISGAYLLQSEWLFKKGSSPMEGHAMH